MKRFLSIIIISVVALTFAQAQNTLQDMDNDQFDARSNTFNPNSHSKGKQKEEKAIEPRGMYVWTINPLFGDRIPVQKDTLQHLFMNTVFTTGKYGEYNTTGNLGAPRLNRIFMDRDKSSSFAFTDPLSFFLTPIGDLRFTNTLSPITSLNFYSCGDRTDGEDYFKALFASNVNKRLGFGMKFNYMYGRGYYQAQSTALFDYTFWLSYIGERYQAHFAFSTDHLKVTENGGLEDDRYITHPEQFTHLPGTSEMNMHLHSNWNKNNALHFFLTHRYNVGFYRKVPMTQQEIEAKKFAMASRKEAEDRGKKENGDVDSKGRPNKALSGRPTDAKVEGDLPTDSTSIALSERISVGSQAKADSLLASKKKEAEDTSWLKNELVPVTSFIHTVSLDKYSREYIAYQTPNNYYSFSQAFKTKDGEDMILGDSINDLTDHIQLKNTFAIAMLEGFNKYVPTGLKAYITNNYSRYELPDTFYRATSYNETTLHVGGQLTRTLGSIFHYDIRGQVCVFDYKENSGKLGDITFDGRADVNIPLFGDTVRLDLNGFYHSEAPDFYMRHYHSRHYWWDNDGFSKQRHTHFGGAISYPKTKTSLRVGVDYISNYTYLMTWHDNRAAGEGLQNTGVQINHRADVGQLDEDIKVVTAELSQNFIAGPLNWENRVTYQYSSNTKELPLPKLNVWSNLYLDFKIAKVLKCHFGAQAAYFTRYYAPEYVPGLSQFAIQQNESVRTKMGNYPFVDVYANFVLKGCRFFVMMSHVNAGQGNRMYFTVPHYPMNERVFRLGISWNFYN